MLNIQESPPVMLAKTVPKNRTSLVRFPSLVNPNLKLLFDGCGGMAVLSESVILFRSTLSEISCLG